MGFEGRRWSKTKEKGGGGKWYLGENLWGEKGNFFGVGGTAL